MKMDISSWTKLNPMLKFVNTKSLFYNKYLYKLEIFAPGVRTYLYFRNKSNFSIESTKKYFDTNFKYGVVRLQKSTIHYPQLESLYALSKQLDCKTRVEGVWISFYSSSQDKLFLIAREMENLNLSARVTKFFSPRPELIKNFLNGEILVKNIPENYQYKIVLTPFKACLDINIRQQIADYLVNIGDKVVYNRNFLSYLIGRKYPSASKLGFYAEDDKIYTFLKLMAPDIVDGIFKLVRVENK